VRGLSELEDKLNSILNSPEQMSRIMELAKNLSGENHSAQQPDPEPSGINEARMLSMVTKIMAEFNNSSCGKEPLISAIKPYLSESRRDRIDKAARIAKIAKVARTAFNELGGERLV